MKLAWRRISLISLLILTSFLGLEFPDECWAKQAESVPASLTMTFPPYPPMVHPVRVGIVRQQPQATIATWSPGQVFVGGKPVYALNPGRAYVVSSGRIVEIGTNRSLALPVDSRAQIASRDFRIWANNRWYRGSLEVISLGNAVTLVNLLDLEEYLLGVVPSEMPASWHPEALKAQAVAARSYAWAHLGRGSKWLMSRGYDLVPDERDQMYKGLAAEATSTFAAVQMTRGLVLKNSGRVKPGFYRASVGNAMENLNIRRKVVPGTHLEKICDVKNIVGVTVKQWDSHMNAHSIQIMGASKTRDVYGVALAEMLGLSTAGILDCHQEGPNWAFTYRGPGNGIRGLSQHGANMLAKGGWRFDQILQQYYEDKDGKLRLDYVRGYVPAVGAALPSDK
jgi:stage II sporulation protein D